MEKAIKKAKEGGWEYLCYSYQNTPCCEIKGDGESYHKSILLDPLFWQALGKAEGWDKQGRYAMTHWSCDGILDTRPWFNIMMNFMSQVIGEGKDINSFFESLLT